MIETAATSIIVAGSLLLLVYWFRYVCLLVLAARPTRDYALIAATANLLAFPVVQARLRGGGAVDLDALMRFLDRDYQLVVYLLTNLAGPRPAWEAVEKRMLHIDYRLMRLEYRLCSGFSAEIARGAVEEMSKIVAHLAGAMGQRIVAAKEALTASATP